MASSTIFWVFGMTQPGIESQSLGPLANTLLIQPLAQLKDINVGATNEDYLQSSNNGLLTI